MSIKNHISDLIVKGVEFQVGIRGQPQPIGPGKVEEMPGGGTVYRMLVPATIQANKHSKPSAVLLPVVFSIDEVALVIEAPILQDGSAVVVTPSNGNRTPAGLHIPGQ